MMNVRETYAYIRSKILDKQEWAQAQDTSTNIVDSVFHNSPMQKNFDIALCELENTVNTMQKLIHGCIKKNRRSIFPSEKNRQWEYVCFELYAYLLVLLETIALKGQDASIRKQLFFYIADNVQKTLNIKKEKYYSILRLRMDEYISIETDNEIDADERTERHLDHFIGNLAYVVYKKDLYQWKGSIKPMPALDMVNYSILRTIYNDKLMSINDTFIITHKNLFMAKSNSTKLPAGKSVRKTEKYRKRNREAHMVEPL
jgi:hypothetical protein